MSDSTDKSSVQDCVRQPLATHELPGVGGILRARNEDFFVQEIALYEPSDEGEHVMCEIQKVGLTTHEAISRIARQLKVKPGAIGYAGLKDKRGVTRQHLTISQTSPEAVARIQGDQLSVLWVARNRNKLRIGHLKANRFAIRLRNVDPLHVVRVRPILDRLIRSGLPNYFGEQRYGRHGLNDRLGFALMGNDGDELIRLLRQDDDRQSKHVIRIFEETGSLERAMRGIDRSIQSLWMSAAQSRVFDAVVADRIDALGTLVKGDLAFLHDRGACFVVEDPTVEQSRADRFEISPSGPMFGSRMTNPRDDALQIEQRIFSRFNLPADLSNGPKGERRPLRVKPEDCALSAGVDESGPFIAIAFTLPPGSFATTLMREVMKNESMVSSNDQSA